MTSITQVHSYIKEHFKPGDILNSCMITDSVSYLTRSSISAALWKLGTEDILIDIDGDKGPYGCTEYMVNDTYLDSRGNEDREAPEPGTPRKRTKKPKVN